MFADGNGNPESQLKIKTDYSFQAKIKKKIKNIYIYI